MKRRVRIPKVPKAQPKGKISTASLMAKARAGSKPAKAKPKGY